MSTPFVKLIEAALDRRRALLADPGVEALRIVAGSGDGMPGVYLDRYGPGAVLILYEGATELDAKESSQQALEVLAPLGVRAIYVKHFAKDRSHLGGIHPDMLSSPEPGAGETLPEWLLVREHTAKLEVRLYDGFSTGLFCDQRDNRRFLAGLMTQRADRGEPVRVLNTFCYTGGFSVACALAAPTAEVASVDVSPRYLDWAKRNFVHNGLDAGLPQYRFAKMDTFEFLDYAKRKGLQFDLVILDPPSYSAGNKKRGVRTWSSVEHYAELVHRASGVLAPDGARLIFASTNTLELCAESGRGLERQIVKGLGKRPQWINLPAPAMDFAPEPDRLAVRLFKA